MMVKLRRTVEYVIPHTMVLRGDFRQLFAKQSLDRDLVLKGECPLNDCRRRESGSPRGDSMNPEKN